MLLFDTHRGEILSIFRSIKMEGTNKTKKQLLDDFFKMRRQISELENTVVQCKKVEKELKESEKRFRHLVESFHDIVFITDYDSRMLWANPSLKRQAGFVDEDFYTRPEENIFIHPDDAERVTKFIEKFIRSKKRFSGCIESRFFDKWGKIHWYSSVISKIIYKGHPALMFITQDIRERKEAEQALQESLQTSDDIVNSIPTGLFIYQFEAPNKLILLNGNPESEKLTGVKVKDWIGREFDEIWPEAKKRGITDAYLKVMETGKTFSTEDLYYKDQSLEGAFRIRAFRIPGERLAVAFENITGHKQAEDALKESEASLRGILRVAPIGIGMVVNRVIEVVNDQMCTMTGYSQEELIEKNARFLYESDEEFERVGKIKYAEIEEKGIGSIETRFKHKNGHLIDVFLCSHALDPSDLTKGVIFTASDITERKKMIDALKISEVRFRSLVEQTSESIFCYEYDPPVDINLSIEEQIKQLYLGVLVECNDVCAQSYGAKHANEVIGKKLTELFETIPTSLDEFFRTFIEGGYRTADLEATEVFQDGTTQYYVNNGHSVVDNGKLIRIWGTFRNITDRKRAEEELNKEREFTDAALNAQLDTFFVFDPSTGKAVRWNEAFRRISGYSDEEISAMKAPDSYYSEEDLKKAADIIESILKEGEGSVELSLITKNGIHIPTEYVASPLKDKEGNPKFIIAVGRDITERKKAEETLREGEDRFRTLSEASFEGIAISDKGYIIDTNEQVTQMFGYEKTELIGKPVFDLVAPESRTLVKRNIESGYGRPYEHLALHNDGKIFHVEVMGRSIPYKGRSVRVTAIRDITERKKAEEALRESEGRYRTMAETSPDGVTTSNLEGSITYASQRTAESLGFERAEDLIGRSIFEFIAPEDQKIAEGNMIKTLKEGMSLNETYTFVRKDGTQFPGELSAAVIRDDLGNPQGFIGISRDISDRKKIEKEIQEYQEKLRSLASTLSLTEQRERRNIASFVHDQISQKLALAKIKLGALNESLQSTEHNKPVKDIRDLIEETVQDTRNLTFDLSPPILYELGLEQSLEWLADQFTEKYDLAFTFRDDDKPKPLDEDIRVVLFQAARELLMNTIKHSQAKTVKIATLRENGNIRLSIEDDGIGFDTSITQPYSVKTGGFGLFNIRERLDQFRGEFKIQSQLGKGTKATLIAPLKQDESKDNKNASASKS